MGQAVETPNLYTRIFKENNKRNRNKIKLKK